MMNEASKTKKRRVPSALLFFSCAAAFLFCASLGLGQRYNTLCDGVQVRCKEPQITASALRDALKNEEENGGGVTDAVIWLERKGETATGTNARTAPLRVLQVYGDSQLALPASFLAGAYPPIGDGDGCALDRAAAEALFGGSDVVGCSLTCAEVGYTVRGVFEGLGGVLVIQADQASERKYDTAALRVSPGANGEDAARVFLASLGVATDAVFDAPFAAPFVHALSLLPAWVLCGCLIARLLHHAFSPRARLCLLRRVCAVAAAAVASVLLLWAAEFSPAFPDRFIPTKWSDFSFWSQRMNQLRDTAASIRALEPLIIDSQRTQAALCCALAAAGACFAFFFARKNARIDSATLWFWIILTSFAATFCSLFALNAMGLPTESSRALWLAWPFAVTVQVCLPGHFETA